MDSLPAFRTVKRVATFRSFSRAEVWARKRPLVWVDCQHSTTGASSVISHIRFAWHGEVTNTLTFCWFRSYGLVFRGFVVHWYDSRGTWCVGWWLSTSVPYDRCQRLIAHVGIRNQQVPVIKLVVELELVATWFHYEYDSPLQHFWASCYGNEWVRKTKHVTLSNKNCLYWL